MTDGAPRPSAEPALPALRPDCGEVDVLVIGRYFCDLVYSGLARLPIVGEEVWASSCAVLPGGTYITAAALHRLGVSCAWTTCFGSDPFSRFVLAAARTEGLAEVAFSEVERPLPNISVALSFGSDRSFVSYAAPVEQESVDAIYRLRPRVVMRPGLGPIEAMKPFVAAAHDVGAIVIVDPQSTSHTIRQAPVRELLEAIDVFAPNEREALLFTGEGDTQGCIDVLKEATGLVLLKLGAGGAIAADRNGKLASPAFPTVPVETTGAGDCFNAAFVMAMLQGATVGACLRAGNAAGSLSTRAPSSQGMPTRPEVDAMLAAEREQDDDPRPGWRPSAKSAGGLSTDRAAS